MTKIKHKYNFIRGKKIIHSGITNNLKRRGAELKRKYRGGYIQKVGKKTTEKAARKWEKTKRKSFKK